MKPLFQSEKKLVTEDYNSLLSVREDHSQQANLKVKMLEHWDQKIIHKHIDLRFKC